MNEHPAAALYPTMTGKEFDELVDDIRVNGQAEPIVIYKGQILDGRNRWRACEILGKEPITVEWDERGEPEAFVTSMNLHRRHLTVSQRALIAAELVRNLRPGSIGGSRPAAGVGFTTSDAAKMFNLDRTTIQDAKKVLLEGTDEEIAQLRAGVGSPRKIADGIRRGTPRDERKRIVESVKDVGKNPERIAKMRIEGQLWAKYRDALMAIGDLPKPAQLVPIVRKFDKAGLTSQRLAGALSWIEEFADAWTSSS